MQKKLSWKTVGFGKQNIVLIHGFGFNSEVWKNTIHQEDRNFRFHLVDLPGHGCNHQVLIESVDQVIEKIWENSPKRAIWLGWSLGGLIASEIALRYKDQVRALITVSSSLYFIQEKKDHLLWPGITEKSLKNFKNQLSENFEETIRRFLFIQNLGSNRLKKDLKSLKNSILSYPRPNLESLSFWINVLRKIDLRKVMSKFKKPFLRIYGEFDQIVPKSVIPLINFLIPNSQSVLIKGSSHAPFISHSEIFNKIIFYFYRNHR
ncbi:pimeloyl-ACP methyl ester esterase BioH [Candidatus Riesia pediculicola]|uniref:pimeloyl-ACP methyl ester esterase BioH n=1 Tax=Candidatus Riesia pediculicola TaxID=401619 RepID=UPI0009C21655|nr:pimeloyl-ACP methyl ester esterase BioH [Candidatus Riesia pediculicola]ARC54058.1 hypothetical protein AOE57_00200 [Candidatus Riesia pediculicola]